MIKNQNQQPECFPDLVPVRVDSIWERTECVSVFLVSVCGFGYKEPRQACLCLWALARMHGAAAQAPKAAAVDRQLCLVWPGVQTCQAPLYHRLG